MRKTEMGFKWKPKLPKIHIPNPVDIIKDAVDDVADATKGVAKAIESVADGVGKAIDDVARLPKKVGEELERDVRRISNGLDEARKDVAREAGGAINLITDAAKAAAKFSAQEAINPLNTINGALHRRDVISSIWFVATNPIKTTNENAMQATRDSALLAVAVQVAATAYGGPAGAAAYAAWTAYNLTGGDINAALRAGVTTGLIAAATGAVANMPSGADKIAAETTLKAAIAKSKGKSTEEIAKVALASLVQVASTQLSSVVNNARYEAVQKAIVSGALGGASVAAVGGNTNDVRDAFLKNGGDVLVQGVRSKVDDLADAAKDSATGFLNQAIENEDLERFLQEYKQAEATVESAETIYSQAKHELDDVVGAAKIAADESLAQIAKTREEIQSQVDAACVRLIQAREEAVSRIQLVQDEATKARDQIKTNLEKQLAEGKTFAETKAAADDELLKVKEKADSFVAGCERELAEVVAKESKIATEGQLRLEGTRFVAMNELMRSQGNAIALSNDWVLSWDANLRANAGSIGVVLTYAGPGSEIDSELDKVENPVALQ
jgi:gas vesicle protein